MRRASRRQDLGLFDPDFGGSTVPGLWSPSVDFSGQIENAGHLAQPTAIAMGHSVMAGLLQFRVLQHTPAR
jgi:hypothetical protein